MQIDAQRLYRHRDIEEPHHIPVPIIGYLSDCIRDYFGNGQKFGVQIDYVEENEPLGSAGALFYLRDYVEDDFIFAYGDLIFDIDMERLIKFHKEKRASITLLSHPNSHPFDSDIVVTDSNNCVIDIKSKNVARDFWYHNLVNSGIFVVSKSVFRHFGYKTVKMDFEKDVVWK